jgi:hypothetical protein
LQDGRRGDELEALQAIDPAGEPRRLDVTRRWQRIAHPASELDAGRRAHRLHLSFDMLRRVAADRPAMQITEMRQVHQIVDHQHVIAFDRIHCVLVRPGRVIIVIGKIDDRCRVGQDRVTEPDPQELVLLDQRIASHRCVGRDLALPRHLHTSAGRVDDEAMIAALDTALDDRAQA